MAFPDDDLNQTAVYWSTPTKDGFGGHTWATPVEIDCRWVGSSRIIKVVTISVPTGEELVSRAEVQVGQDVDEQGMLYLGELTDLSAEEKADPMTVSGAYSIKRFDKVPTIDGDVFYRKAWL